MPLRILIVDDFEPWRRFVSSALQKQANLQILHEVSDGLAAVYKAEELRPDLILLDIGLPALNGIKAARRIRELSPNSKILFLTEQHSPDVAEAALEAGGAGYVVKSDAGKELLPAVRALSEGKRYVSSRLVGQVFFAAPDDSVEHSFHELQLNPNDASFLDGFTSFVADGLNTGNAVVVLATEAHRNGLIQKLQTQGFDLDAITKSGAYIPLDVHEALSSIMLDDQPDPVRFWNVAASLFEKASKTPDGATRRVFACGECAPFLWKQGKLDAALRLEELWDAASQKYRLKILCGYLTGSPQSEKGHKIFERIRSLHSNAIRHDSGAQLV